MSIVNDTHQSSLHIRRMSVSHYTKKPSVLNSGYMCVIVMHGLVTVVTRTGAVRVRVHSEVQRSSILYEENDQFEKQTKGVAKSELLI